MNKRKFTKSSIMVYAFCLVVLSAAPLLWAVPNVFQPDTVISSSQMNENFDSLDQAVEQLGNDVNDLCQQPGQIVYSAEVSSAGAVVGDSFTCSNLTVTVEPNGTIYDVTLDGLEYNDVIVQVTSITNGQRYCNVDKGGSNVIQVRCFYHDQDFPTVINAFFITLINR